MRVTTIVLLFFIVLKAQESESARILGIFSVPSKSHTILAYELFKELVKLGHEITVISPEGNELKNPPENYSNIVLDKKLSREYTAFMDNIFGEVDVSPILKISTMLNQTFMLAQAVMTDPKVVALLKSDAKFDLVISELAMNEVFLGFSEFYKCPHILISTVGATSWAERITSNPAPTSYIPHVFLDLTDKMNLSERILNTIFFWVERLLMDLFHYPKQKELYETSFPNSENFRPFWEKHQHGVSMIFLNSHFTLSFPRPYLPNLIEVGGMHIKKTTNPLPADIQKFIDDSEHGVVYFSLGGNLNPSVMPKEKQEAIINSLSKIKERILWKWDDLDAKVDQNKFLVKKWFPQDDILANPKVKVFITHGGLLGGTESIYYAKPVVTIPIFGDQKLNAARSVINGYGVRVDYSNLTEASLTWGLQEILNNDKYSKQVQELSARFHDKPLHPVDLAVYYVEYVMRHKGASFMQSSATYLNLVQVRNLDVYAIILAGIFLAVLVPYLVIKKILWLVFGLGGSSNEKKSKVKKN